MAQSKTAMGRLRKLEHDVGELKGAVVHIGAILVDQNDRMDRGFRELSGRIDQVSGRIDQVVDRIDRVTERFDQMSARLDRLIALTMEERTLGASRLLDIERRVSRLEEHIGPLPR